MTFAEVQEGGTLYYINGPSEIKELRVKKVEPYYTRIGWVMITYFFIDTRIADSAVGGDLKDEGHNIDTLPTKSFIVEKKESLVLIQAGAGLPLAVSPSKDILYAWKTPKTNPISKKMLP